MTDHPKPPSATGGALTLDALHAFDTFDSDPGETCYEGSCAYCFSAGYRAASSGIAALRARAERAASALRETAVLAHVWAHNDRQNQRWRSCEHEPCPTNRAALATPPEAPE